MIPPVVLAAYVVGSLAVGFAGRQRRVGFLGFLLLSVLITPVLAWLVLWLTAPAPGSVRSRS